MAKKEKNDKPSVLAFEKKLVPSDALLSSMAWSEDNAKHACEGGEDRVKPLKVVEKTIRGTQSHYGASEKDVTHANLQKVDSCALPREHDTLLLRFTLKVLSGVENPSACNEPKWAKKFDDVVKKYKKDYGFVELANRYANNIANARFLWRNRVGADNIETCVRLANKNDPFVAFKADDYSLHEFKEDEHIKKLAEKIAATLRGDKEYELFHVDTCARIGMGQEVYPSEEFVDNKQANKEGEKSKELYAVDGVAAMHSQKIGNALRTIDTWYPESDGAIAVEPFGSVTNKALALRHGNKNDFYTLLDKWVSSDEEIEDDAKHYVMAVLVRGGVFGFGKQEKKKKSKEKDESIS